MERRAVRHEIAQELADALDTLLKDSVWTRGQLIRAIIAEWLEGDHRLIATEPPTLGASKDAIDEAVERRRIILQYRALTRGKRAAGSNAGRFLDQFYRFCGRRISAATLFHWIERYRDGGLDGLIDRRRLKRPRSFPRLVK